MRISSTRINFPTSRFAVAAFDAWPGVHATLRELHSGDDKINNLNCLGYHRVLSAGAGVRGMDQATRLHQLPFQDNPELISCTSGPVADRLARRLELGAPTLQVALSHWLIPRHAAHLQEVVEDGRIVLWLQLFDNDDERRAYEVLLARSSNSVGVHDLIGK